MGLDVTAYTRLTRVDNPQMDEYGEPIQALVKFYDNPDFPNRIAGVEGGVWYDADDSKHLFCGGYGSYGHWRRELAKLAGYASIDAAWGRNSGPFWELLNFSDCEGTLGTEVAKKLYSDFIAFDERAKKVGYDGVHHMFYTHYQAFKEAMRMAADGGAVKFH